MQFITCHAGQLQKLLAPEVRSSSAGAVDDAKAFRTGIATLDALAPGGAFGTGAVHELLAGDAFVPMTAALLLSRGATRGRGRTARAVVWCDPRGELHPPALASAGVDLRRAYVLRPANEAELQWAVAECLRCPGVAAVVAPIGRLTRVGARRLQLAAEAGRSVGLLLRPAGPKSAVYAAATRWLVAPAPGERTVQRWRIQLLHGHGGRVGQGVYLEFCRETGALRAVETVAGRSGQASPATKRASA